MDYTSTKLTILNTTAIAFSFTNFDEGLRTVVLFLSAIYTIFKIAEIIKNWNNKNTKQ